MSSGSTPSHLAVTRLSNLTPTPRPVPRGSHLLWAVPFGAALLIGAAGFFGNRAMEDKILAGVRSELESRRDTCVQALRDWVDGECAKAMLIAGRRTVREVAPAPSGATSRGVEARLRVDLEDPMRLAGFEAFAIILNTGQIATKSEGFAFETSLGSQQSLVLADVFDGKTKLLPPLRTKAGDRLRTEVLLVATPIGLTDGGVATAALALQVPSSRDFTRITLPARVGRTGESFIFNREGHVLSRPRFEAEARSSGLLTSSDASTDPNAPGAVTPEGPRPTLGAAGSPLPWWLSNLETKTEDFTLTPYVGYRGVPVLGAYRWLPELEVGVIAKMDADEAFELLNFMKTAFWSVFAALVAAGLLMTIGSVLHRRFPRDRAAIQQVGQYRLIEKIGEGAMGRVYRAQHAMLRRPTAVKLLEESAPDAVQRFEREVQLTSQLYHPNTVAIYDYGRTPEGVFYYAMEYLDGIDLAALLQAEGPLPPERVVHVLRQICGSLSEAHLAGLVHRDIKPSNIMLLVRGGEADVVKVVDFGLAKLMEPPSSPGLTRAGTIFGTPGFIPPETLRDPGTFDARGDLYAVGALAYEMLAGKPPFDRTTALEMWHLHVEVAPPDPSIRVGAPLPADLEALVMKLLAKDPANRPQTALEAIDLLDRCTSVRPWPQAAARAWWAQRGVIVWREMRDQRAGAHEAPSPGGNDSTRVEPRPHAAEQL